MPPGGITETPSDVVGGGWFIGHTEAVVTGTLAGYNAVKYARNEELLILPDTLAVGNIISYSHKQFIENRIYNEILLPAGYSLTG